MTTRLAIFSSSPRSRPALSRSRAADVALTRASSRHRLAASSVCAARLWMISTDRSASSARFSAASARAFHAAVNAKISGLGTPARASSRSRSAASSRSRW